MEQQREILSWDVVLLVLLLEEVALVVRISEPLPQLFNILRKILRVIPVKFPQKGHFKSEEPVRTSLILLELLLPLGPDPNLLPYLLDIILQFEPILRLVEILRVGIPKAEQDSLG